MEYIPKDYVVYRKDRHDCNDNRNGGGVLIAIKSELSSSNMILDTDIELIFINIETTHGTIYIGVLYRSPSSTEDTLQKLETSLNKISTAAHGRPIHLLGDMNLPDINWNNLSIEGNQYPYRINEISLDIFNTLGLEQLVKEPTRHHTNGTNNILDLVLSTHPSYIEDIEVKDGISDHHAVHFTLTHKATRRLQPKKLVKMWSKATEDTIHSLKADVLQECSDLLDRLPNLNTETAWREFEDILLRNENKHIPSKLVNPNTNKPWITRYTRRSIRKRKRAYRAAKIYGTWQNYRDKRIAAHKIMEKSHQIYVDKVVLSDSDKSHKKFWNYIKSLRNEDRNVTTLKSNGVKVTNPENIAAEFNNAFSQVFTREDNAPLPELCDPYPHIEEDTLYAHPDHVYKLLLTINTRKSPGPENISPILLKTLKSEITYTMAALFTMILQTGDIPASFKKAHIIPIHKKGDKTNPLNYRPVSLTSILSKLFEKVTQNIIMTHLKMYNILTPNQHGFRAGLSTETQLINVIDSISYSMDQNYRVDCIVTDFSKAFDVVPHSKLLLKCHNYGIRGVLLKVLENFLKGRTQQVKVDGVLSEETEVLSGVPQGTVLGPLLFLLYINDLPSNITSITKLFADDCMLIRRIKDTQDENTLQSDLDKLSKWCDKWNMPLNLLKCNVIHFTRKISEILPQYMLKSETLKPVTDIKYLGITLNEKLNWSTHTKNTVNKAQKVLNLIKRNFYKSSANTKIMSYKTLVRPILEYASSAWNPHTKYDLGKLEKINRQAARLVHNEYSRKPGTMTELLKEHNWPTMEERFTMNRVGMLHKIINSNSSIVDKNIRFSDYQRPRAANNKQILRPPTHTLLHSCSFYPRSAAEWNTLPQVIVDIKNNKSFKSSISKSPQILENALSASRRLVNGF